MKPILTVFLLVLALVSVTFAGPMMAPYKGSAEFERMKSLAGTWNGEVDMGEGPQPMTVKYRVVSGGSAVEELTFAGTPKEMVTLYYDKDGRLAMTHYCSLQNRPTMALKSADGDSITFEFDPTCGINPKTEMHMHSLVLDIGDDELTQTWTLFQDGKAGHAMPFTLKRAAD